MPLSIGQIYALYTDVIAPEFDKNKKTMTLAILGSLAAHVVVFVVLLCITITLWLHLRKSNRGMAWMFFSLTIVLIVTAIVVVVTLKRAGRNLANVPSDALKTIIDVDHMQDYTTEIENTSNLIKGL